MKNFNYLHELDNPLETLEDFIKIALSFLVFKIFTIWVIFNKNKSFSFNLLINWKFQLLTLPWLSLRNPWGFHQNCSISFGFQAIYNLSHFQQQKNIFIQFAYELKIKIICIKLIILYEPWRISSQLLYLFWFSGYLQFKSFSTKKVIFIQFAFK